MCYTFLKSQTKRPLRKGMGWGRDHIFVFRERTVGHFRLCGVFFLLSLCICPDCVCDRMFFVPISMLSPIGPYLLLFFVMTKSKSISPNRRKLFQHIPKANQKPYASDTLPGRRYR